MSKALTTICDGPGCDAVRRETNHWFVTIDDRIGFAVHPVESFDPDLYDDTVTVSDVCGEGYAVAQLQGWMKKQKENKQS